MRRFCFSIPSALVSVLTMVTTAQTWEPVQGQLMTRWAEQVSPDNALREYPRPQLVRKEWRNLNGLWNYAVVSRNSPQPQVWDGKILVPFCVESALSGVKKPVGPDQRLWYRRTFRVPDEWNGKRILLHFGAVDWKADVFVNGLHVGEHSGGYTPFSFDVTRYLKPDGNQELVVSVWDPTDTGTQPRGKQVLRPRGIWYTAVTGIWQTVWLEPVPQVSIAGLKLEPDIDNGVLWLTVNPSGEASGHEVHAEATDEDTTVGEVTGAAGARLKLAITNAKLWSPDSPHLYALRVALRYGPKTVDRVASYFGMRKIALREDPHGRRLLFLNDAPLFHLGPLDQGWWPDGLYTAPTDAALRYDLEVTKQLGFNMVRKHVKIEPARWYYHCDKLGLMVWQDMPSAYLGGRGPASLFVAPSDAEDARREGISTLQFETELKELVDNFGNSPAIVVWVPFNEGWGQYDTTRIARWTKQYDPSRLVDATSGWTDRGAGDLYDAHIYPGPGMEHDVGADRASVLGEFGGLGWPVKGHLWWNRRNWGYQTFNNRGDLNRKYREVVGNVYGLRGFGLAAAVYTQTTDVEGEVNGLMTYDRSIIKFDASVLRKLHGRLYEQPPPARVLVPTSRRRPQTWLFTDVEPVHGWASREIELGNWKQGAGPFQSGDNTLFPTGTRWTRKELWLRRTFDLGKALSILWLEILENINNAEVYLNGQLVLELENPGARHRHYTNYDLSTHVGTLRLGRNILAIHAEHGEGTRSLDAGLYTID